MEIWFFFFSCCGLVVVGLWLWLIVEVVMVGAVGFFDIGIYYFIVVVIIFYCDAYIILLC